MKTTFKHYLISKGQSQSTADSYEQHNTYYHQWLAAQKITITQASHRDILAYIKHCTRQHNTQKTIRHKLTAISHYYQYLQQQEPATINPVTDIKLQGIKRHHLHHILEPHELDQLYQQYPNKTPNQKSNKAALGLLVYQGLKPEELGKLETHHLQLRAGEITVPSTLRSNSRTLKLEAGQILDLYDYLQHTRTTHLKPGRPDNQKLFIHYCRFSVITESIRTQVMKTNPQIKNLQQLRASVITHWVKHHNLREAQYRAGHRYVSSTERYKQNDLEGLQEEINQYHPLQ
ncbi:tyrosine-type recombinase/integrase [Fulvivirga sp. 29W222]|uniref:Tyrosine-type recombinase/integrase n=1 Tax=Fulvivirga marina TaxID=2494733 RepID=A0A937G0A7_9BACT|nr:tyrosine-type recombinase/integrase [Fulvivirga marina]MBL6447630.1 tyrosine-type recombinase/integrase [Fulvivirga marina]